MNRKRIASLAALMAVTSLGLSVTSAHAIINGTPATTPAPFMGSLQRPDSPRPDHHVCGATLIAPEWMVTAGHCVRGELNGWKVRIGSTSVSSGGELIDVERYVRHPDGVHGGDIALLKLKNPSAAQPVAVAAHAADTGEAVHILGWGNTCQQSGPSCWPDDLRELTTSRLDDGVCHESGLVAVKEICVASVGGRGAANMDSGGPALVRENGSWSLAGATSGSGGEVGTDPTIYSSVPAFRNWIDSTIAAAR
ncbi:S1 family peptidase [Streptomyces sp. NPDC051555]|uniref:S1 family peptidase n=1 Tax=Streptomyces sp. NPDC051555 TaxID=3365657 RepID=UPI0037A513E3